MDLMVSSIFHSPKGHPLPKRRPKQLEPKVEFLTDCFATMPPLKSLSTGAIPILKTFSRIGTIRNDLVHSTIADFSLKDGAFTFLKIDVVPATSHNCRLVFFGESEWPSLRKDLLRLGKESQALAQKVHDALR